MCPITIKGFKCDVFGRTDCSHRLQICISFLPFAVHNEKMTLKKPNFFFTIRFTPFDSMQIHINIHNKVGNFKQLRCIAFFLVISRKNIEWRRAHYSKDELGPLKTDIIQTIALLYITRNSDH